MTDDRQHTDRILSFVDRTTTAVSQADVAAGTGIDSDTVDRLLRTIMLEWECTLDVREDGSLVYDFGPTLRRIGRVPTAEKWRRVGRAVWRGFSAVYRASLAVVLLAYAVTFVVLIIAAAIAASVATEDGDAAEGAFALVGAVFRGIFESATHLAVVYTSVDNRGYRHRHFEPRHPVLLRSKGVTDKAFVPSVYDFVLGPPRVQIDDGAQVREVAAFVRQHGGMLTVSDVMALSGMTRVEASRFFSRFVAAYDGDVTITDDGALIATLPGLLASETTEHDEPIVYFWDEYEPPFELTGNTTSRNIGITALAMFNLICSYVAVGILQGAGGVVVALGWVPLVIFGLFLALPLARSPWVRSRNRARAGTNVQKRLYRAIFESRDDVVGFDDLIALANQRATTEEPLSVDSDADAVGAAVDAIGARRDLDEDGAATAALERLRLEQAARDRIHVEVDRGAVVFSSATA